MCRSMNLLQHSNRNMGINLRRVEALVAQHRLDVTNICTAFEHQGRHCVPEDMARTCLDNFGCPYVVTCYPTFPLKAVNPVPPFAEPAKGGARKG